MAERRARAGRAPGCRVARVERRKLTTLHARKTCRRAGGSALARRRCRLGGDRRWNQPSRERSRHRRLTYRWSGSTSLARRRVDVTCASASRGVPRERRAVRLRVGRVVCSRRDTRLQRRRTSSRRIGRRCTRRQLAHRDRRWQRAHVPDGLARAGALRMNIRVATLTASFIMLIHRGSAEPC